MKTAGVFELLGQPSYNDWQAQIQVLRLEEAMFGEVSGDRFGHQPGPGRSPGGESGGENPRKLL